MEVRRGAEGDVEALRAIRLEALADTPEAFGSTYEMVAAWSEERWREAARTWNFHLALEGSRAVGLASGGLNPEHPGTHWLYGMYVTAEHRGQGVAGQLVEAVVEWARGEGADSLYLHVTDAVPRARAFYLKMGFVETGESFAMDRDPSLTLITMARPLV